MTEHVKESTRASLIVLVVLIILLGLGGCAAKTDDMVIRDSIARELDGYKKLDDSTLAGFVDDMDIDELAQFNIDPKDFMHSYLEGFDYTIDDIEVNGTSATALVTLSCKSFSEYESKLAEATADLTESDTISSMSATDLDKLFGSIIMESLAETEIKDTDPIKIIFTKDDKTWKPDDSASFDIANALMDN